MSRKEVPRAGLVQAALTGRITNREGARALHLSIRHLPRLLLGGEVPDEPLRRGRLHQQLPHVGRQRLECLAPQPDLRRWSLQSTPLQLDGQDDPGFAVGIFRSAAAQAIERGPEVGVRQTERHRLELAVHESGPTYITRGLCILRTR